MPNRLRPGLYRPLALLACLALAAGCGDDPDAAVPTKPAAADAAALGPWGVELRHIDTAIDPGNDFYRYVNAGWLETAEIPPGFASNGAFLELHLKTEARVREIIAEASAEMATDARPADAESGPDRAAERIAALHTSYMDVDEIARRGLDPLAPAIDAIFALADHEGVARMMAQPFHGAVVGLWVQLDPGNPERYVLATGQAGLGLPNREYYLRDQAPFPEHRAAYVDYIAGVFERAGIDNGRARAEDILAFETKLARVHWTPEARRDRVRNYHLMTLAELEGYAAGFPWRVFFAELNVADREEIIVNTDEAVAASATIFADTALATLKSYLAFHYIDAHAALLPDAYSDAHFDFYSRRLGGVAERRPRDERAVAFVNGTLGELVGRIYVDRHFPPEQRAQMLELVGYLRAAFRARLAELEWMDEATREAALEKLEAFTPKIGYPERWHDYSTLEMRPDDLIGNVTRYERWSWDDSVAKLDEPRRDWEWGMTPQTVNAYYSPTRNEIVFPAAILQPPFFDPNADPAVNFAAIGGVIGHEMGHGFDDQGSRSDAAGRLRNWWTDEARAQFEARTSRLVAQYAAFEPIEGLNVNGELTLGENIGDIGGLALAHAAWRRYVDDRYDGTAPVRDGYTGDQRFFMGWAQVWRTVQTEESERKQVLTDPHSPARYRVNGVVRNLHPWYEAFDVDDKDALYLPPNARVEIW